MGKATAHTQIDLMLDQVTGDAEHVCSAEPLNYTEASATYQLATQALIAGNFVKANGDVSGRKQTVTPDPDTLIDNTGTANHIAITNGITLVDVTTSTPQALTAGGTVTIGPFAHEIGDPT